jgi:hypothetical protein
MSETPQQKKDRLAKAVANAALEKTRAAIGALPGASSTGATDFGSTTSTDYTSWTKTVSGAPFDMSNFPTLNTLGANASGAQVLQALEKMAHSTNSNDIKNWRAIRPTINFLGGDPVKLSKGQVQNPWTSTDLQNVKSWLTGLHFDNTNLAPVVAGQKTSQPVAPKVFDSFAAAIPQAKAYGSVGVAKAVAAPPVVQVPATSDLTSIAQDAFVKTLGRAASPEEAAQFAQKFQSLAFDVGNAKNASRKQSSFNPVDQPIQFTQAGGTPANSPDSASKSTTPLQAVPNAGVAAENFAVRNNATQASSKGLDDLIGGFLNMAKNGGQ